MAVFNICISKPHKNLATPSLTTYLAFPVHKTWLGEYFLLKTDI
jgi:hypothetical protein